MNKIVTICGSMKFQEKMIEVSQELELKEKYVVIQCVYSDRKSALSSQEINILSKLHYNKIDISDAIYVVNVGGYIGESTKKEIAYAESLMKEILYLEPINKF